MGDVGVLAVLVAAALGAQVAVVTHRRRAPVASVGPDPRQLALARPRRPLPDARRAVARHGPGLDVALVWAAWSLPIFARLHDHAHIVYGGNDFGAHVFWATEVRWFPPSLPQPHFLFHVLLRLAYTPFGAASAGSVAVWLLAGLTGVGGWLLFRWLRVGAGALTVGWAALGSLFVLVAETPLALTRPPSHIGQGSGYFVFHLWATPTNALILPTLLLLSVAVVSVTRDGAHDRRDLWGLSACTVLATISKPNVALVIVPAGLLLAWWGPDPALRRSNSGRIVLWAGLPLVAVGAAQTVLLSGLGPDANGGIRLAPFHEMRISGLQHPAAWSSLLAPALILAVIWPAGRDDPFVRLGLLAFAIGLVQFALLGETGYRRDHANWGVSAFAGLLLVWLAATRVTFARLSHGPGLTRGRTIALGLLLALMMAAGASAWLDSTRLPLFS